ncbi:MAG TPA: hypothetical protein PLQ34_09460 [Ferrovaceae bacterium]|nr:hypothetical protein [Ferrovaceae bacterium]
MAISQTQCTVFKKNLLSGLENFTATSPYIYKLALYNYNANLDNTTTAYTTVGEITGSGYTAGGLPLTIIPVAEDFTANAAYVSFQNVTWTNASFSTVAGLIYNSTTGSAVCVLNFGAIRVANGNFTIQFPQFTAQTAVLGIS